MQPFNSPMEFLGRLLLGIMFVLAGVSKLGAIEGTIQYMADAGLPSFLAYPAALFELVAGLAVIVGYQTRIVALLLAGFCIVTAVLFHYMPTDQIQMAMMMKNLAVAGGFLVLAHAGAGPLSLDARRK